MEFNSVFSDLFQLQFQDGAAIDVITIQHRTRNECPAFMLDLHPFSIVLWRWTHLASHKGAGLELRSLLDDPSENISFSSSVDLVIP